EIAGRRTETPLDAAPRGPLHGPTGIDILAGVTVAGASACRTSIAVCGRTACERVPLVTKLSFVTQGGRSSASHHGEVGEEIPAAVARREAELRNSGVTKPSFVTRELSPFSPPFPLSPFSHCLPFPPERHPQAPESLLKNRDVRWQGQGLSVFVDALNL